MYSKQGNAFKLYLIFVDSTYTTVGMGSHILFWSHPMAQINFFCKNHGLAHRRPKNGCFRPVRLLVVFCFRLLLLCRSEMLLLLIVVCWFWWFCCRSCHFGGVNDPPDVSCVLFLSKMVFLTCCLRFLFLFHAELMFQVNHFRFIVVWWYWWGYDGHTKPIMLDTLLACRKELQCWRCKCVRLFPFFLFYLVSNLNYRLFVTLLCLF